jgi:hypothetical protein
VITSLLEISVSKNKTRRPPSDGDTLDRTSFAATRSVCLEGALARPCTILVCGRHGISRCPPARHPGSKGGKRHGPPQRRYLLVYTLPPSCFTLSASDSSGRICWMPPVLLLGLLVMWLLTQGHRGRVSPGAAAISLFIQALLLASILLHTIILIFASTHHAVLALIIIITLRAITPVLMQGKAAAQWQGS